MKKWYWVTVLLISITLMSSLTASASSYSTAGSHEKSLQFLESKGIGNLEGFGRSVTRGEFAMYIVRVLELPSMVSARTYADVPTSHPYYNEIQTATAAGIIQGDTATGKFHPSQPISRIHMVRMLTNALDLLNISPKKTTKPNFKDTRGVSADYANRITITYSLGIITGNPSKNEFMPFKPATVAQSATFIMRFYNVVEQEKKWYSVANIVSGSYQIDGYYDSFAAAKKNTEAGQVILYKDDAYYMTSGIAYLKQATDMKLPNADVMTLSKGTELHYVTSSNETVTVRIGDVTHHYKQKEVELIPDGLNVPRSYYTMDGDKFVHFIYQHIQKQFDAPYTIGKAPTFAKRGERYYSVDSVHFTTLKGEAAGTYYNYYQWLPMRTATAYTVEQLDAMIHASLVEVETRGGTYQHALEKSKLLGLGDALKEAEATYKMNAALLLAIALYESDYGMNAVSQRKNHLIVSHMSELQQAQYDTPAEGLLEMTSYLSSQYVTPSTANMAYGGVIGSKLAGLNKKYTLDPFWGAKVASIYAKLDAQFGLADAKQNIGIAFVKQSKKPLALLETTNGNDIAFTYNRFGFPVAITAISGAYTKIVSDDARLNHVFIPTTMLQHVTTSY
ncbi:MAG: S-layer homology domain-containing protein [Caryophanon sp.]|nr:S-layer homology domain-containing protein [Caryophanon sp.]